MGMASQTYYTVVLNLIFLLSLIVVSNLASHIDARQLEKSRRKEENAKMGNKNESDGKMKFSGNKAKMNLGEMKDLPPLPDFPLPPIPEFPLPIPQFPFPPPFDIPNLPPFPNIPPFLNFPLPPFRIPPIPFLSPPPA